MLNSIIGTEITLPVFFVCTGVSLLLGIGTALLGLFKSRSTHSLAMALAILPAVVQVVIMLVNGNIGAGVAVAGAFGLVRFRSAPGTAKEIGLIFLAMAIGLATGMGYVVLAVIFFVVIALVLMLLTAIDFGQQSSDRRVLKITIPENLDYDALFDDLFQTSSDNKKRCACATSKSIFINELCCIWDYNLSNTSSITCSAACDCLNISPTINSAVKVCWNI